MSAKSLLWVFSELVRSALWVGGNTLVGESLRNKGSVKLPSFHFTHQTGDVFLHRSFSASFGSRQAGLPR
jgi:hypothetical protein